MQRLIVDYIRRHPLSLGFALILSSSWWGTAQETDNYLAYYFMALIVGFVFFGLMLDLSKGYLRMVGMLPISNQQIVKSLWFLGVCLGPLLACLAYWTGFLVVAFGGAIMGTPKVPGLRSFLLFCELCICISAIQWSPFAVTGDPTKRNCSMGLLGWVSVLLIISPLFFPKGLWKALYDMAPVTTIPVILIAGGFSYLVTPLILTSGLSLSWPRNPQKPLRKTGVHPIIFQARWVVLLRTLFNPMLKTSLMMGIILVIWIGVMVLFLPSGEFTSEKTPQNVKHFFGMMMTMMVIIFILGIGASSMFVMRGLRVLPVSTQLMAGLMTLLPLEAWVGFTSVIVLLCGISGEWAWFSGILPVLILLVGFSTLILALVFRNEHLIVLYIGVIMTVVLCLFFSEQGYFFIESWRVCSLASAISFVLAYALNLNTLHHKSSLYHSRVVFGQPQQAPRWQAGG